MTGRFSHALTPHSLRLAFSPLILAVSFSVGAIFDTTGTEAAVPRQYTGSCNDCHGFPPVDSTYRNVTTGGFKGNHGTHAVSAQSSCLRCHEDSGSYSFGHMTSSVTLTANVNASPAIGRYRVSGVGVSFTGFTSFPVLGTCTNVNCHFETATPTWGSTQFSGAADCGRCHGAPPTDGNHWSHDAYYGPGAASCTGCHPDHTGEGAPFAHATSAGKRNLGIRGFSYSKATNLTYPNYLPSQTSGASRNGTCSSISCHGGTSAAWGATSLCLDCHSVSQGGRAPITGQFSANSHHIQGAVTNAACYQCHWEANSDGSINTAYHNSKTHGGPVDLVIYGAGIRPAVYSAGTTAIQYTADGSRTEIGKITTHCLGCHSDANNDTQPFGDGKSPRSYAWDGTSIAARYAQTGVTTWGKYSTVTNAAQKRIAKAFSAHGNPGANKRGWDTVNGVDGAITNTSGSVVVACFDCHNSHGSTVSGTATRYASATPCGGILKDTTAGIGGYTVSYRPYTGGSTASKNRRNPGASLCLDCHLSPTAVTTPWGYSSTYGASQKILGYWDPPFMGYSGAGATGRFAYKSTSLFKGGHFGASSALSGSPMASIDGLCTPCHDPHGVSPSLGADQQYAVPLLKGTWITSPYKEDVAPPTTPKMTNFAGYGPGVQYRIDQNTFGTGIRATVTGVTQSVEQSAGLCLSCHPQNSLTAAASPAAPNPWKSKNRIHESVKGWKTSNGTVKHSYTCSKCHSAHSGAVLPRLMVTNCLDSRHKGRVKNNAAPVASGSSSGYSGSGSGHIPGSYSGGGYNNYGDGLPGLSPPGDIRVTCHESATANGGGGTNQGWNNLTPWVIP